MITKVAPALSEALFGSQWPAQFLKDEILPRLEGKQRRIVTLASWIVELAPLVRRFRLFHQLSLEERRRWVMSTRVGITSDMLAMIAILLFSGYYVNPSNATKVGYERRPLLESSSKYVEPPPRFTKSNKPRHDYDVVIVGSGAGGSVAAWILSRSGLKVCLLEVGPEPREEDFRNEYPIYRVLKYYWDQGLTFTWGTPIIPLPLGKVLGGGTVINSGTMFEVPDHVLRKWDNVTRPGISPGKLREAYGIVRRILNVSPIPEEVLGNNARIVHEGAKVLGLKLHGPIMRPLGSCRGTGECTFGCPYRGKLDMRLTFLREALSYGAEIFTNAEVVRIIIENGKAKGVIVRLGDSVFEVRARAVVVSAGALSTPRLLRRSGVRNRNLGRHLNIHPAAGVVGIMEKPIYGWRGTLQSYYVADLLEEHGVLLEATFPPPGIATSGASPQVFFELERYPFMVALGAMVSDLSEGSVFGIRPGGVANYQVSRGDMGRLWEGLRLAAEILFAAGARKVYLPTRASESAITNMSQFDAMITTEPRYMSLSAYHPTSTARMGGDEDVGVVDSGGRVYGIDGLYVADASVIPTSPHVNPQLTINALSLIIAEEVARELGAH